jgi:integrase
MGMRKRLTKMTLEQKAPAGGRVEVRDTDSPLVFRLTSKDARSLSIRTRLRGQQIRLTYPGSATIDNLDDARRWAHDVAAQCKQGIDPREEEHRLLLEAKMAGGRRFDQVVVQFIERYAKKNKSWTETLGIFQRHVLPRWRERQLDAITRADVACLLDEVEDKTSIYTANRVLAAVRKLFNWSVTRGLIELSPVVPGMARKGEVSRTRYLSPDELRIVWNAADQLGYPAGAVIRLLITTGQRRGELTAMTWDQLDLEGERLWSVPAEHTKSGRGHLVPFSDLTLDILKEVPHLGDYVLTSLGDRPVSGFGKWKKKLDEKILVLMSEEAEARGTDPEAVKPLPHWRLHDLRRTVATHMEELGIPPHIVGSVLNHDPKSYKGITSVNTRGDLIFERRKALTAWARFLSLILDEARWEGVSKLLSPETEAEAARTDEFRRMIQADAETWETYLVCLTQAGHDTLATSDLAISQDKSAMAKGNGRLTTVTP